MGELQLVLYSALDQIDVHVRNALQAATRGDTKAPDTFLGVLTPALVDMEEHSVYGFISATKVKIMAVVREHVCKQKKDEELIVRSLLKQRAVLRPVHRGCLEPLLHGSREAELCRQADSSRGAARAAICMRRFSC